MSRPFGHLTDDLEELLGEAAQEHELQLGEILAWVKNYVEVHYPEAIENYVDNTVPVYYYGHQDYVKLNNEVREAQEK